MIDLDGRPKPLQPSSDMDPHAGAWSEDPFLHSKNQENLTPGWEGVAVSLFGFIIPILVLSVAATMGFQRATLLLLKHPIESIIEIALLVAMPVGNLVVWRALCRADKRYALRRGIQNGLSVGTAFLCTIFSISTFFAKIPAQQLMAGTSLGFWLALVSLSSLSVSLYLMMKLRSSREIRSAKQKTLVYSLIGILVSVFGIGIAESKAVYVRVQEYIALVGQPLEQESALSALRSLNLERDLRMECANSKSIGLSGFFIPIKEDSMRQLYFAITGQPFRDDKSSSLINFSNSYLRRNVVGDNIAGLSLVRSAIIGEVHPRTLSSTINWTFVLKNTNYDDVEARAEIGLPANAVISDATIWINGVANKTSLVRGGEAARQAGWINAGHETPLMVTDLGHGRTLLHCYPVPAEGQLKVSVNAVIPLKTIDSGESSLVLPHLIDTNFAISGEHNLRIKSPEQLTLKSESIRKMVTESGKTVLSGELKDEELSTVGTAIIATRNSDENKIAVFDKKRGEYIVETVQNSAQKPLSKLVVVLDGSDAMKSKFDQIKAGLASIPSNVKATLIVAKESNGKVAAPVPLAEGLDKLHASDFSGGQSNLQAVVNAANYAGETANSAVLWIHGPQPSASSEIYVLTPYIERPSFFELSLADGVTDGNQYFKNHSEIGPFAPVGHVGSIPDDLKKLCRNWLPGSRSVNVAFQESAQKPTCPIASADEGREIIALRAREACDNMLASGHTAEAAKEASSHGIVTPVTSALMISNSAGVGASTLAVGQNVQQSGWPFGNQNAAQAVTQIEVAPQLQGAVNGTIGPQGSDAEFISGVNTAGTVRVNNLANLEALLNIAANGGEILLALSGAGLFVMSASSQIFGLAKPFGGKFENGFLMFIGISAVVVGLMIPGVVNWFVASARDANLFS